ncbi:MAG: hypothetical protein MPJ24_00450 [Pirellulaceae bacterium]|nr:hypothetical protein [Pirellulaceae bacterium]
MVLVLCGIGLFAGCQTISAWTQPQSEQEEHNGNAQTFNLIDGRITP